MRSMGNSQRKAITLAFFFFFVLAASCAVVEPHPGGPIDTTPPTLALMVPDSGAVGVGELKTIRLTFSEKMDRTSAVSWLFFFPDQRIRQTKWHGATEAEVILEYPLPPDTVMEGKPPVPHLHRWVHPFSHDRRRAYHGGFRGDQCRCRTLRRAPGYPGIF